MSKRKQRHKSRPCRRSIDRQQAEQMARKAKADFRRYLATATICGGLAGGFANYEYHRRSVESKRQEIEQAKSDFKNQMVPSALAMIRRTMKEKGIGYNEAVKETLGIDVTNPEDMRMLQTYRANGELKNPKLVEMGARVVRKMADDTKGDGSFLAATTKAVERMQHLQAQIDKEDTPQHNFAIGAGIGASIVFFPTMVFVMGKKARNAITAYMARVEEAEGHEPEK